MIVVHLIIAFVVIINCVNATNSNDVHKELEIDISMKELVGKNISHYPEMGRILRWRRQTLKPKPYPNIHRRKKLRVLKWKFMPGVYPDYMYREKLTKKHNGIMVNTDWQDPLEYMLLSGQVFDF
ncbi:uncharacterized protein LOC123704166 [Colias croceus]|uniref:uncharacterized protein LOC123704166 n=1 Tax=Colias crocea TaxID=72248 RepID=UPI001E27BBBC|nr:uncharacterized protein LOC123704166 [Colias croceus]